MVLISECAERKSEGGARISSWEDVVAPARVLGVKDIVLQPTAALRISLQATLSWDES